MTIADRIDAAIDAALGSRIVGCVVIVFRNGAEVHARAAGLSDREAGTPMRRDAIFRLASVTKPIVAAAVLRMVDAGLLTLDDPVGRFLPWFTPPAPDGKAHPILIRHLLTHTAGLGYDVGPDVAGGLSGPLIPLEENLRRLARRPLMFTPGTAWEYGMSIDVLGGVIEAIEGTDLAAAVAKWVTGPLGMKDARFGVADKARLAPPYKDGRPPVRMIEPDTVIGEDGSSTVFSLERIHQKDAPLSGGAGMAGTADDVMRLMEALRAGDFLSPGLRAEALGNCIPGIARRPKDAGKGFGFLGAVLTDPAAAETAMPKGAVDWGGAWGHNWVIDPGSGTCIVTCTNTTFEGCNGPFREEMNVAVFGA